MNIYGKILITTLPLVLTFLLAAVGTTYFFSKAALTDLAEMWLKTRLAEAMRIVQEQEGILHWYGLEQIPASIAKAQMDTAAAFFALEVGDRGFVFVVDAGGTIVVHPERSLVGTTVWDTAWFSEMERGKGRLTYTAGSGKSLAMYDYFVPWQWYVIAADPTEEVYAVAHRMQPYLMYLGLFGSIILAAVLMVLTRRLTGPLRSLTRGAERIGNGDLQTRIAIRTKDEFSRLAEVFNQMTVRLQETLSTLQLREERFRSLIENASDIVTIIDANSTITYVSPSIERILGYPREELIGRHIFEFVCPQDDARVRDYIDKHLNHHATLLLSEFRFRHRDGTWRTLESSSKNLLQNPSVAGIVINSRDISERKLAQAELQQSYAEMEQRVIERTDQLMQSNQRLEREIEEHNQVSREKEKLMAQLLKAEKMEAIGTLAGGIAHDFNNLLMGIQGNAAILLSESKANPAFTERLHMIEEFVQSGASLTKQLLGFARLGKYEVKFTNINDLIGKSAEMFGRTRKEVRIQNRYQENVWTVKVDRGQIEQVLLNLFINAWQSMPGGGELFLETSNTLLDERYVAAHQVEAGRYVKISVTDTGTGMDAATRERIFDPFFTTKRMARGTGLGLASAYGIVKNHGGIITVYSELGQGSTFSIYLPAFSEKIDQSDCKREKPLKGNESILVVDDEPRIVEVSQKMLEALGYAVITAVGGKNAVSVFTENRDKIDLVVLDMIMPDLSGGETFDQLRRIDPAIKVLLASGYSLNGQASEILARGCNGFIQKPFNLVTLSHTLRRILDEQGCAGPHTRAN